MGTDRFADIFPFNLRSGAAAAAAFTTAAARALFPFFDFAPYQEENHRDHRKQQHDGCDIIVNEIEK